MFEQYVPLYLPIILVFVVGGFWWAVINARITAMQAKMDECCKKMEELSDKVEEMKTWLAVGDGSTTYSVAEWIEKETGGYRAPSIGSRPGADTATAPEQSRPLNGSGYSDEAAP